MKIVVIGGTGALGSKVVAALVDRGHDVVAASRRLGIDAITGEGLAEAFTDAGALVDAANPPTFDDDPVLAFFTTSTTNLLAAAKETGVRHYVAVSIVGCDQLPASGYMRAKVAQERLVERGGIAYSIVRATQFVEFTDTITASLTVGDEVRVPDALIQPITTADLADHVARVAESSPIDGIENVGGPAKITFEQMARDVLATRDENKTVVVDPQATYFGASLSANSLVVP
jgi:uncharacterized protein YbjT (DUF2867 family)